MNLQAMDPGEEQAEELVLLVEELAPAESLVKVDHEDLVEQLLVDELLVHRLLDTEDAVDKPLVDKILSTNPLMQTSFTKYLILTLSCTTSS